MRRYSEGDKRSDFPFSGQLIDGKAAAKWLLAKVEGAAEGVSLCSAFLRSEALRTLYPSAAANHRSRILTRWRLGDLLNGASDLDAYPLAKQLGFTFYIRQDFHGKVFSIPGGALLLEVQMQRSQDLDSKNHPTQRFALWFRIQNRTRRSWMRSSMAQSK